MRKLLLFASLLLLSGAAAGAQGSPGALAWSTEAVRAPVLPASRTAVPVDPADSLYRLGRTADRKSVV